MARRNGGQPGGYIMDRVSRRTFLGGSGALAFAGRPSWAAGTDRQCASAHVPPYLTVDCAARRNYQEFRKHSERIFLVGLVSLASFTGRYGQYGAGSLFLFPVLRPPHQQPAPAGGAAPPAITGLIPQPAAAPVPQPAFPAGHSEESLLALLEPKGAARSQFVGFLVDVPADDGRSGLSRFTAGRLPDGKSVRIEWTVSNLNRPWFGSPTIPHDGTCNGAAWRKVVVEGLKQATVARC
jgi:hypothetical protein